MTRVIGSSMVEVAVDTSAETGESPVWDVARQELLWVDIPRRHVHRWRADADAVTSTDVGQPVGALALREHDGLVLALRDGFGVLDDETGELEVRWEVEADRPDNRMNDGACDRSGRFWAGTMATDMRRGAGSLYRLDPSGDVARMIEDVSVSNGLCWSRDDRTMYFIDSLAHGVDAFSFDPDAGKISDRRRLIDIPADAGLPDGMTIDATGCLWVAIWDGWSVRRYTPDGRLDTVVELPTAQITSCAFGDGDLGTLYITSAAAGLDPEERRGQTNAGAIFAVRPDVEGLAPARFGG